MKESIDNLKKAFFVSLIVLLIQIAGWYYSNSLALLGDTGHVFSDLLALGASLGAMLLAMRAATSRRTFGFHRVEVFAALFNGILLVLMALFIAYEAYGRYGGNYAINGLPMLITSIIGLAGNIYVASSLQHDENLNVRSAFIHAAGDALSSIGVIAGAVVIMLTGLYVVDIAVSLLISVLILFSAYNVLRGSLSILLESAPHGAGEDKIRDAVMKIKGVRGVHDIHVWRTCSDMIFAMMHVETDLEKLIDTKMLSDKIEDLLNHEFSITHTTIEFEPFGCSCENKGRCDMLTHKKKSHKH
jgi:cobalt-zinc-cadmium efflux system protein